MSDAPLLLKNQQLAKLCNSRAKGQLISQRKKYYKGYSTRDVKREIIGKWREKSGSRNSSRSIHVRCFLMFMNPLAIVLLVASAISAAVGEVLNASILATRWI